MYKRIIVILVFLNIVVLSIYQISHKIKHNRETYQVDPMLAEKVGASAIRFEQYKILSQNDFKKINLIQRKLYESGVVSDSDFKWLIEILNSPPMQDAGPEAIAVRHVQVLHIFEFMANLKNTPPSQRERIYVTTLPFLSTHDPTGLDVESAANIFWMLNDNRAIPYLVPFVNSSNTKVKFCTRRALSSMGFKVKE